MSRTGRPKSNPINRFMSKVIKTDTCWIFTKQDRDGYGIFGLDGKQWRAHRFMMSITDGLSIDKPIVMHTCDNPCCVNPNHLVNGTVQENNLDKLTKRRHLHTLTDEQVLYIRASNKSTKELADEFNVSFNVIWYCLHHYTYKHIL